MLFVGNEASNLQRGMKQERPRSEQVIEALNKKNRDMFQLVNASAAMVGCEAVG